MPKALFLILLDWSWSFWVSPVPKYSQSLLSLLIVASIPLKIYLPLSLLAYASNKVVVDIFLLINPSLPRVKFSVKFTFVIFPSKSEAYIKAPS